VSRIEAARRRAGGVKRGLAVLAATGLFEIAYAVLFAVGVWLSRSV